MLRLTSLVQKQQKLCTDNHCEFLNQGHPQICGNDL